MAFIVRYSDWKIFGLKMSNWNKNMDYNWVNLSKFGCFELLELNTLFYKNFNGLSEYERIF